MTSPRGVTGQPPRCVSLGTPPRPSDVVLVPGQSVPLLTLALPDALIGQAREQVALRHVTDRLGLAPGSFVLRPFPADRRPDRWTAAFLLSEAEVTPWRALRCRAVLPDYLSLPAATGIWTLQERDGVVSARLGPRDGFTADAGLAASMLRDAARAGGAPRAILTLGPLDPALVAEIAGIAPLCSDVAELDAKGLPQPRAFAHGELDADLRRNPAAARARLERAVLPWRWTAAAAVLALALWTGAQTVAIRALNDERVALEAAMTATLRRDILPAGPILDVRTQVSRAVEARLADARGAETAPDPLALGRRAAVVIADGGARTLRLAWPDADGIRVAVGLADFAAVDALTEDLRAAGLRVDVVEREAAASGEGVRADLRVSGETP